MRETGKALALAAILAGGILYLTKKAEAEEELPPEFPLPAGEPEVESINITWD